MISIVVILEAKDPEAFAEFELQAISILDSHSGMQLSAFEADSTISSYAKIIEVHYIQFLSVENYNAYGADPALKE